MKQYLMIILTLFAAASLRAAEFGSTLAESIDRGDEKKFNQLVSEKQNEKDLKEALEKAASNQSSSYLKILLAKQSEAKSIVKKDGSIFLTALSDGNLENIKVLETAIDMASLRYENGNSALDQAITYADLSVIKYIAEKNSNLVSHLNDQGESILFSAVRRGNRKIVDEILKFKNLPTSRTNKKGESAESVALALGYKRIAAKVK
jgi:ankyrin repeat protein